MIKEYYANLINRIFNVLFLYENKVESFNKYVESLAFELSSNNDFVEIQQIRFNLIAFLVNDTNHSNLKRLVFKSINLLDFILSNLKNRYIAKK